MSITATERVQTSTLRGVLADYDLHHSPETDFLDATVHVNAQSELVNPPGWTADQRRVPAYRPVNRNLEQDQRRVYQNGIERAFVNVMFSGVFIEAVSAP